MRWKRIILFLSLISLILMCFLFINNNVFVNYSDIYILFYNSYSLMSFYNINGGYHDYINSLLYLSSGAYLLGLSRYDHIDKYELNTLIKATYIFIEYPNICEAYTGELAYIISEYCEFIDSKYIKKKGSALSPSPALYKLVRSLENALYDHK